MEKGRGTTATRMTITHPSNSVASPPDQRRGRSFSMRDLIFVSLENWDEIWRRNQFVCAKLAKRHPEIRILFVGPARNVLKDFLREGFRILFAHPPTTLPEHSNIALTHPWQVFPNRFRLGRWFNEWLARRHVRRVAAQLGMHDPVLWLNPHDAAHMAGRMGEATVVYDVTDDWSKISQPVARMRRTIREDARLCRQADAVIVCSEALRESKQRLSSHVYLVPNGVDARHYDITTPSLIKPPGTAPWRGHVFGYTGTLHGDRIDVELVRRLAGIIGYAGSVVLIGPDHLREAERERLRLPNIFCLGAVPYVRLPEYMRRFDVCIVPHKVTPFTESLNPIKLWEYLALGKPVVSTRVAGFRDYPRFVYLAEGAEEIAARAMHALSEPKDLAQERRAEAARHSWEVRCDAIEEIIADCLERRSSKANRA